MQKLNITEDDLSKFFATSTNGTITDVDAINEEAIVNGTSEVDAPMCDLQFLQDGYRPVQGYLSLVICIFGTIANLVNIAVLTRKEMNGSPINRILTGKEIG